MSRSKKIISMFLTMLMILSIGCISVSAETKMSTEKPVDTISRGYKIINGDVYDLYGNLLIKMYDGYTADGYALDPNFTVHYDHIPNIKANEERLKEEATLKKPVDTISRGYKIINGDVYDLYGNLLIKMYNGFTSDGYTLDPNFTVHDTHISNKKGNTEKRNSDSNNATVENSKDEGLLTESEYEIFNGTGSLTLNKNGSQGIQLGPNFTASSSQPNVYMHYYSGVPSGVNFSVYNITANTVTDWVSNVKPGYDSRNIQVYNASRPYDTYCVKASAEGLAGGASAKIAIH